jgi:hypothetical protein
VNASRRSVKAALGVLSSDSSNVLLVVLLLGGAVALVKALRRSSHRHGYAGRRFALWRRTPSGKLRATTHDGGDRGPGPDSSVYGVADLPDRAKKVYLYLTAIADAEGYCFPFFGLSRSVRVYLHPLSLRR